MYRLPEIETPESFKNFGYGFSSLTSVCDYHDIDCIDCEEVAENIRDHLNKEYQNQDDKYVKDGIDFAIKFIDPLCRDKIPLVKIHMKDIDKKLNLWTNIFCHIMIIIFYYLMFLLVTNMW